MAVFTPLNDAQMRTILASYDVGEYVSHEGILQGIQNSNFHVHTSRGAHLILTIFEERTSTAALPFFFAYTDHLVGMGIPCPGPILTRDHQPSVTVEGKTAALFPFLEGASYSADQLTPDHCHDLGRFLARMHLAVGDFTKERENPLSLTGWRALADKTRDRADSVQPGLVALIDQELAYLSDHWPQGLIRGAIHADVFPDNVFFRDGQVSAIIDFYYAVTDMLAYDLAIVVNAWCFDQDYQFKADRFAALLAGYQAVRALTPAEQIAMPVLYRAAAIRFLMTRLHDWVFHDPQNFVKPHDPLAYVARLRFFQRERVAV